MSSMSRGRSDHKSPRGRRLLSATRFGSPLKHDPRRTDTSLGEQRAGAGHQSGRFRITSTAVRSGFAAACSAIGLPAGRSVVERTPITRCADLGSRASAENQGGPSATRKVEAGRAAAKPTRKNPDRSSNGEGTPTTSWKVHFLLRPGCPLATPGPSRAAAKPTRKNPDRSWLRCSP